MPAGGLIEREEELATLERVLSDAEEGRGGVVLVEGEAGIGKSALLAAAHGMRPDWPTFTARGAVLEIAYGYGGLRQLFEARLATALEPERQVLLSGPASRAAAALGFGGPGGEVDEFAVGHGVYWLVDAMAASAPVLIVVDDVQWIDPQSLRVLNYLARRLSDVRAVVMFGRRTGEPATSAELEELGEIPGLVLRRPRPLSATGTQRLVEAEVAGAPADLATACHVACGGNPFLTSELARSLPADARPDDVTAYGPEAVERSVTRRLGRLGDDATLLARAIAILDSDADLRLAARVADVGTFAAAKALDALVDARLISPGRPLRFAHPLLQSSVYRTVGAAERSVGHRRAAEVLSLSDAAHGRAAAHLLRTEPVGDPWVVAQLRAAADAAISAGAPATAVPILERALDEPAVDSEPDVLRELGHARLRAGENAVPTLERALAVARAPQERVRVAVDLAQALGVIDRYPDAVTLLAYEAGSVESIDVDLAWELRSRIMLGTEPDATARATVDAIAGWVRDGVPSSPAGNRLLIAHAHSRAQVGDGPAADVWRIAQPAFAKPEWWREHPHVGLTALYGGLAVQCWTGHLHDARATATAVLREAQTSGEALWISGAAAWGAHILYQCGDLLAAEATARLALDFVPAFADIYNSFVPVVLAQVLIARGKLDEAERVLGDRGILDTEPSPTATGAWVRYARCELRAAQGRWSEATGDLMALAAHVALRGGSPPGWGRASLDVAVAVDPALGISVAEQMVGAAEAWGDGPSLGAALCNLGRIVPDGLERLAAGVALLEPGELRIETVAGQVAYGTALARAGYRRDARAVLEGAVDLAHRCGATLYLDQAHRALRALGARPRRSAFSGVESLTVAEYRVAQLAADGRSNPEICQALFLTRSTVEKQLTAVYRKLGINSRDQLHAALQSQTLGEAP